jgi:hypothetical protein
MVLNTKVILDKSQRTERYSSADFLAHAGITVLIDDKHKIAHNKIMIIDSNRAPKRGPPHLTDVLFLETVPDAKGSTQRSAASW